MDELKYINSLIRHATRNLIISDYILLIETDENFQKILITTYCCVLESGFEIDARACERNLDPPDVLHKRSFSPPLGGWNEGETRIARWNGRNRKDDEGWRATD